MSFISLITASILSNFVRLLSINQFRNSVANNWENKSFLCQRKIMNTDPVLKGIQVVYTSESRKKPPNAIAEMYGKSADINCGFGGNYVWLIPIWTTDMSEGVTKIRFVVQFGSNSGYSDLAAGAGGNYRYLKMEKELGSSTRIKSVGLLRSSKAIYNIRY